MYSWHAKEDNSNWVFTWLFSYSLRNKVKQKNISKVEVLPWLKPVLGLNIEPPIPLQKVDVPEAIC